MRKAVAASAFPSMLVLSLAVGQGRRCYAQAPAQSDAPAKVAALHDTAAAPDVSAARPAAAPDPASSTDIAKELAAMKARIELLEAELKARGTTTDMPVGLAKATDSAPTPALTAAAAGPAPPQDQSTSAPPATKPEKPAKSEPFAFADWSWMNGSPHNKEAVWDSKFFTPEIRLDTDFVSS
ncbi:MAG TPA: hypothetical protein VJX30_17650, partial [Terriglobales bacterium]|nr:hypothetical protein [Terriglobales bacterium]